MVQLTWGATCVLYMLADVCCCADLASCELFTKPTLFSMPAIQLFAIYRGDNLMRTHTQYTSLAAVRAMHSSQTKKTTTSSTGQEGDLS
jgi:hypothetical protein